MARVRRSVLFMPGDSLRKIEKAATLPADSVIMDLEDGVAFNRKTEARATIVEALRTLDFGGRERLVRINPVGSGLEMADLDAVAAGRPSALVTSSESGWISAPPMSNAQMPRSTPCSWHTSAATSQTEPDTSTPGAPS